MNIFSYLTKFSVITLPFYVFFTVFFGYLTGFNKVGFFLKEGLLILIFLSLVYEFIKAKKLPKLDILDYLVFAYIGYGVGITLYNSLGLNSIIYGGRYDFMFLIVMIIYKHGAEFLKVKKEELIRLFVYSGALSLLFGILVKFRLKEEFLVEFGYVDYASNWVFKGGIPVYHGLENSGIRRFQGILDGPNAMAYFLVIFSSMYLYLQKKKNEFYVYASILFLFWLVLLTYSRSALLGIIVSSGIIFLVSIKYIYKNYRKVFLSVLLFTLGFLSILGIIFQTQLTNIIFRTSSTTGHFDRMSVGIERFKEKPLGAGLAEAGPAYRNIYPDKQTKEDEVKYIPESWYIQVLIEGGIIYFVIFISILLIVLRKLYSKSKIIFGMFLAILVMNIFLHIFEATYLSMLMFTFIGLFISKK
ncbi:MAG: O-antigen ligase family protein [Candidatus Gracilibacteria bacterium]|nr:O-antigen ligase family protein [Candidatus Gracilibacteria bacterium]